MKQFWKKVGVVILIICLVFVGIVFTYTAYDIMDYYNIGAPNS